MAKLQKAQMGKIVKSTIKAVGNYAPKATEVITKSVKSANKALNAKVIPKGLPATIGSLAAAGYVANKVYGGKKSTTVPKKKTGGSISAFDKYKSKMK
jgi:hypothetical protein